MAYSPDCRVASIARGVHVTEQVAEHDRRAGMAYTALDGMRHTTWVEAAALTRKYVCPVLQPAST
jgi:hypothetical protein